MGIKSIMAYILAIIKNIFSFIPALVYEYCYSQFYTKITYRKISERINSSVEKIDNILDVGTATGHPLFSIINSISKNIKVLGIDIDKNYIPACTKLFQKHPNVQIKEMNFYELQMNTKVKFDIIIFGSSFMLMPNQQKALQIAKKALSETGKIYFLMTIYQQKSLFTWVMDYLKPYLKYITTVDFGRMTYMSQFEDLLNQNKLQIKYKHRVENKFNLFLKFFNFYVFETQKISKPIKE